MSHARLTVFLIGTLLSMMVTGSVGATPTLGLPLPGTAKQDAHSTEKIALGKRLFLTLD